MSDPRTPGGSDARGDVALDEEVWALLEGELAPERARAVEARVAARPELAARVAEIRHADAALRELPAPGVRGGAREELWRRVQEQQRARFRRRAPRRRRTASLWAAGAAATAAAFVLAWLGLRTPLAPPAEAPRVAERRPAVPTPPRVAERDPEPDDVPLPAVVPEPLAEHPAPPSAPPAPAIPEAVAGRAPERPTPPAPGEEVVPAREPLPEPTAPALAEAPAPRERPEDPRVPLSDLSDEELVLALELEILRDLPVIENLDLLEALGPLEAEDRG